MPTFVSLVNWTDQSISQFQETAARADAAKELARRMGGELKDIYWTIGQYDLVAVADFPDDETGTAFLLALGSQGNTRTHSMRAFTADEIQGVIDKLG